MPKFSLSRLLTAIAALSGLAALASLSGCLYTTHHFNNGRLLEPGETALTLGAGRAHFYSDHCPDYYDRVSVGNGGQDKCVAGFKSPPDTVSPDLEDVATPKVSLGYRLGIRKQWGPLTGLEMGWAVEMPTNPATLEFDLKAGLPIPKDWKASHSLSAGWGVGMWADNSWFLEYAASRSYGPHALYANYRYTWLASQPQDLDSSFNAWKFVSHKRHVQQAAFGLFLRLPKIVIIPDYVSPEVVATFPLIAPFSQVDNPRLPEYQVNFNLGFGWNF